MNKNNPLGDAALRIIRISLNVALRAIQAALSQVESKPEPDLTQAMGICPKTGARFAIPPTKTDQN